MAGRKKKLQNTFMPLSKNTLQNVLILNGPNLNLLGKREPEIYGTETLESILEYVQSKTAEYRITLQHAQSNHEGELIDEIHRAADRGIDGIVFNPAAFTHYSLALRDAIAAVAIPTVEVHISDISQREPFRRHSVLKDVCIDQISAFGKDSYVYGVEALLGHAVASDVQQMIAGKPGKEKLLKSTVNMLADAFPKFDWTGIYLLEGDTLVVHAYVGAPTPHERIPVGKGICGAAVANADTIIVPDVNADPRYLACSLETKSEIVVPIYTGDTIAGEIDIDSYRYDAFKPHDRRFLERIAALVGQAMGGA